jgi:hypothetical protein
LEVRVMVLYIYLTASVVVTAGLYINKRETLGLFFSALVGFAWPIVALLLVLTKVFETYMLGKFRRVILAKCAQNGLHVERRNIKLHMEKGGKGLVVIPDNDYTKDIMQKIGMELFDIDTSKPPEREDDFS